MKNQPEPQAPAQSSTTNRFANATLLAALAGLLYGAWHYLHAVGYSPDIGAIATVAVAAIAMGLIACLFLPRAAKANAALTAAALCLSFALGNFMLHLSGRSLAPILEMAFRNSARPNEAAPLAKPATPKQAAVISTRGAAEVDAALSQAGIPHVFMYNSPHLLPLIADGKVPPFLPLGSASNTVTIACNEGDQQEFPLWNTDRYGFNNDDTAYAYPDRLLIVGDSFAQGSCVHQSESVAGVLRRNGYPAASFGIGGFGPILELAALKEYGERFKPKTVLWFYFDGNDITDLKDKELRSSFLLQYLNEGFTQHLADRQTEVDSYWKSEDWRAPHEEFEASAALKAAWEKRLDENLPLARKVLGLDVASLQDDESLLRIFERVMKIARDRVSAWGGRIVFVAIPNQDDYHGRVPPYRLAALNVARRLGLPIVDVDAALRVGGDPLQYFARRDEWSHFNPRGYALMAQQISAALQNLPADGKAVASNTSAILPAAAAATPPSAVPGPAATQPNGPVHLEYPSIGVVAALMPSDPGAATIKDGVSFLGYDFVPKSADSVLRVRAGANGFSNRDNDVVLAIFRDDQQAPLKLETQHIPANGRALFDISVDSPVNGAKHIHFDVRMGVVRDGVVVINGPKGGKPAEVPMPFIAIDERGG